MVQMVARLCVVLSCLSLLVLGGCSSGSQAPKCVPGASVACACPMGQQGAQTCNSAGTFGVCSCSVSNPVDAAPDLATAAPDLATASQPGPEAQPDATVVAQGKDTSAMGQEVAQGRDASTMGQEVGRDLGPLKPDAQGDLSTADGFSCAGNATEMIASQPPVITSANPSLVVSVTFTKLTYSNTGRLSVAIKGADAISFSIRSDGCSGSVLGCGGTCTVQVGLSTAYQPQAGDASLEISDDPNNVVPLASASLGYYVIAQVSRDAASGDAIPKCSSPDWPDCLLSEVQAFYCVNSDYFQLDDGGRILFRDACPALCGLCSPDTPDAGVGFGQDVRQSDSQTAQQALDAQSALDSISTIPDALPSVFDVCGDTAPQYGVSCDRLGCKCILVPFDLYYQLCDPTSYKPCAGLFNSWGEPLICETVTIVCQDSTSHSTFGCSEGPGPSAVPLHVSNCQPG